MARIIFKCPYIKGKKENTSVHLLNYVKYISTREGVELTSNTRNNSIMSNRQSQVIQQILKDFPMAKSSKEYSNFVKVQTFTNASAFITKALEENFDKAAKKKNYIDYIANRPNVEKLSTHGLFSSTEENINLNDVIEEVANHKGNVWLPIISLKREDACKLGYDSAESWQKLLTEIAPNFSKHMNIPIENFKWYAAFHDEGYHPHIHMVCYSTNPSKGFLNAKGISNIKSLLVKEIFHQDLMEIYSKQTTERNLLTTEAKNLFNQIIKQLQQEDLSVNGISARLLNLSEQLKDIKGKKVYGYLPKDLKKTINEIVDEIQKEKHISEIYNLWYKQREEIIGIYKDEFPDRLPLSQNKEFRQIKNIIIKTAINLLDYNNAFPNEENNSQADLDIIDQLLKNAKAGNPMSQYKLAQIYLSEKNTGNNITEAIKWLKKSSDNGNQYAQLSLGKLYFFGDRISSDKTIALKYFKMSADHGNKTADVFINNFSDIRNTVITQNTIQLLRNIGNIFKEKTPVYLDRGLPVITDKKLKRKILAKREALGFTRNHKNSI